MTQEIFHHSLIDRWIANRVAVAAAVMVWIAIPTWLVFSGLTILADAISMHISPQWQSHLGDYAKREIRYAANLNDSLLTQAERDRVHTAFDKLRTQAGLGHVKLELMRGMHNAFALPGDTVVILDELVRALDEEALMAVLAHELGHVKYRHVMRRIVGSSMLSSLLQLTVGHSSAGGKIGGLAGQAFIGSAYSRQDEMQADAYAADLLRQVGVGSLAFVRAMQFFQKMEKDRGFVSGDWTSSHPATEDRIKKYQPSTR
jgi:predicted Zn-dependent protease